VRVALVNTNRIKPPIAPIGLDYLAEALHAAGHEVEVLDLCWADDWQAAIPGFFDHRSFGLVGVTLRNTDDCAYTTRHSFLPECAEFVHTVRRHTDALVVLGGVGFSVMPEQILDLCDAEAGIWGAGEFATVDLANLLEEKREWRDLPHLVRRRDGSWRRNPAPRAHSRELPPMRRRWVDNPRYFREGGQAGIETKRGCSSLCIYCADPIAKGRKVMARLPGAVADELQALLGQGIDHVHTCDSEFNIPEGHAREVCGEMIRRHLGRKLQWYAYCSATPFPPELARLMRRAGCAGINFGVDSGDAGMLKALKRDYTPEDILKAARSCKEAGLAVMFDLLLGAPGETRESIARTIELMRRAEPDRIGVAVGVRVYPGTHLAALVTQGERRAGLTGGGSAPDPLFFMEPNVAPFVFDLLDDLIGEDRRFLFFDPSRPDRNYNYNANQRLVEAIGKGFRGAYWDILRRYEPEKCI
jgi:hypothetical protein